ncbi:hypothetical protein BU607_01045 [Staphylococcus auricularis]|uniref:Uncharacterized protein n=1 Tax=Staphylococcus auricularis TaxID=29379 RepID=A0ABX5IIB0_9STAP|nr:hypothetical protein BU607_01045 [Staphylococcus auricularis]PTH26491.1 hypothetical protein BU608_04595 [Staphylococcus auricularis]
MVVKTVALWKNGLDWRGFYNALKDNLILNICAFASCVAAHTFMPIRGGFLSTYTIALMSLTDFKTLEMSVDHQSF